MKCVSQSEFVADAIRPLVSFAVRVGLAEKAEVRAAFVTTMAELAMGLNIHAMQLDFEQPRKARIFVDLGEGYGKGYYPLDITSGEFGAFVSEKAAYYAGCSLH